MADKLNKAYERVDGTTLVDPREYYGARQTADGQLLSWIQGVVSGLGIGDSKTVSIPHSSSQVTIRKIQQDMYSGWVSDEQGDIKHKYDRLTLPALVTQIESVEELSVGKEKPQAPAAAPAAAAPIVVVNVPKSDEGATLQNRIKSLESELSTSGSERQEVASKLNTLIEGIKKLGEIVNKPKEEKTDVATKLTSLKEKVENGLEKAYVVDQIGQPDVCTACSQQACVCFSHLSRPVVQKTDEKVKIVFGKDFNNLDRLSYLKHMKYVIDQRLTKQMEKGMDLPPPPPAIEAEQPAQVKEAKQHRDSDVHMRAIADVESAGGRHTNHALITSGMHTGHRAGGSWAFMPKTAKDVISGKMGAHDLKEKHGHLLDMSHEHVTKQLNENHELSSDVAHSHHAWLMQRLGNDHKKVAHAWYNGIGKTRKSSNEEIDSHPYVQQYMKHYRKHKIVQNAQEIKAPRVGRDPFQRPPGVPPTSKKDNVAKSENVSSVALMSGDKILMGQRRDNGKWTLPGGHANMDEKALDCASRELAEETGVCRPAKSFKHLTSKGVDTPKGRKMIHAYRVNVNTPSTTMTGDPDEEVERWHWVDIKDKFLPSHIGGNLHSPKNITLEALGIKPDLERKFKKYDYSIYDEISKTESKGQVFLAFDGDNIGAKVEQAAMRDDLDGIKEMHESILRGQKVIRDYGKKWEADIYIDGGDDIAMVIDRKALKGLEDVRLDYKKVTGHSVTAGIGDRISRAGHALLYGKLTGKDKAVVWSPKIDSHLEEVRRDLTPAEKLQDHGLLTAGAEQDLGKSEHVELEHYSRHEGLKEIDPSKHGSGEAGAERKRKTHPDWQDRSYFYEKGSKPEPRLEGLPHKYTVKVPKGKIYDLKSDRDGHRTKAQNEYGFVDHTKMERNIKEAGWHGYQHTGSAVPNAVAVFHPTKVDKEEKNKSE
jgi:ADP-ribose pyrophosphatase YjhB (NUDIX family)